MWLDEEQFVINSVDDCLWRPANRCFTLQMFNSSLMPLFVSCERLGKAAGGPCSNDVVTSGKPVKLLHLWFGSAPFCWVEKCFSCNVGFFFLFRSPEGDALFYSLRDFIIRSRKPSSTQTGTRIKQNRSFRKQTGEMSESVQHIVWTLSGCSHRLNDSWKLVTQKRQQVVVVVAQITRLDPSKQPLKNPESPSQRLFCV